MIKRLILARHWQNITLLNPICGNGGESNDYQDEVSLEKHSVVLKKE
jgi:hypothetical protein